jgi:signal transduction histidine kinase
VLIILLVVIIIWNRSLKTIIDRKSRSLIREELSQIKLALRIDERTHLAVELHDSLSQNLSGIACQIAATKGLIPDGSSKIAKYLSTAERMLGSCRNELRRCIWDLRENALDEKDFSEAIRKTLDPVSIGAELTVQIDIPRSHMDDSTAHSILCIIRELVTNAIRHGKASSVHVAGEVDARTLRFSVADNGCGFNPVTAPDANDGHFGLEGIRERIKRMNGSFELKSSPENGCTAVITISCQSSKQ